MTLREWLDVYTRNGDSQLVCAWRKRAWRAMRPVVEQFVVQRERGEDITVGGLLNALDEAAYDARIDQSTKRWRQEYEKLSTIARAERTLRPTLSADEVAAVLVAADLVEMGRVGEAEVLLDEQAPNRLTRPCPACGAKAGKPCFDLADIRAADLGYSVIRERKSVERVVPHESRVSP